MPLLVSVRSAEEVSAALAGGAEIIDAKDPARGPLGPVDAEMLRAIAGRTPPAVPLSIALGDLTTEAAVRDAVQSVDLPARRAPVYLKLGFAGVGAVSSIESLLRAATAAGPDLRLVAVAYADHGAAASAAPGEVLTGALAAGAHGLLVDTWSKDGRGLLECLSLEELNGLGRRCRDGGLLFALAGSLNGSTLARVAPLADVVGVRGAACRGGRSGTVDAERVAALRRVAGAADLARSQGERPRHKGGVPSFADREGAVARRRGRTG